MLQCQFMKMNVRQFQLSPLQKRKLLLELREKRSGKAHELAQSGV